MAFKHGRRFKKRRFAKKRRFTKKKTTRTIKRRYKARRPMRRTRRRGFRNLRGLGNFYSRKYVFTITQQPIDLWFGGVPGNVTVLGDFDIETLSNTTPVGGTTMLGEINAISSLFQFARVKRCRLFWKTSGDKTNARYNLGNFNQGGAGGGGVAAGANANMLGTNFCGTYPRRGDIAPNFDNIGPPPYTVAFAPLEPYNTVMQRAGFKPGSVWGGSRSFLPSLMRRDPTIFPVRDTDGNQNYRQQSNMYPVYNKWVRTNVPQQTAADNTSIIDPMGENVEVTNIRYQGMCLSLPQVGSYSQQNIAANAATGDVRAVMTNGDYFTTLYLEIELQWKSAVSSLSMPEPVAEAQRRFDALNASMQTAGKVRSAVRDTISAFGTNGKEGTDGPPLPKLGRFSDAADAVVAGMNILSRMKRD